MILVLIYLANDAGMSKSAITHHTGSYVFPLPCLTDCILFFDGLIDVTLYSLTWYTLEGVSVMVAISIPPFSSSVVPASGSPEDPRGR